MLAAIQRARPLLGDERPRVLNLFGYTGAATLIAARAGAEVAHVDASKKAIAWARENQAASCLGDAPVRWLLDDARKFVAREVRRGRTYHVVLVDPPKFGRGPGGEVWELFEHLPALLADCVALLDPRSADLVLTAYAIRASALSIGQLAAAHLSGRPGTLEMGELAIREETGARLVPTSLFARWSSRHA
jgi:23S rRNA (cytosine1962-C5)-methyltransferase